MLVLSRKQDQQILIGENVKITVLKIRGNAVRLGIEAPRDVSVVRGELPKDKVVDRLTVEFKSDATAPLRSSDSVRIIAPPAPSQSGQPSVGLDDDESKSRLQQIVAQVTRS